MHEYSIVSALIERVERRPSRSGAKRVVRVCVTARRALGRGADLLATAYDTFRERTICEGAPMELDLVPAAWACRRCGCAVSGALRCAKCDAPAALVAGDEILLSRIELEVSDV